MTEQPFTFQGTQEVACARSACKRLLASPWAHLTQAQRETLDTVLECLAWVGAEYGIWTVTLDYESQRALHFALSRQRDNLTGRGETPAKGGALAAMAAIVQRLPASGGWMLANGNVVQLVKLGFGDTHQLNVRSLVFEVDIPDRPTFEACLTDGIVAYNRFCGTDAAQALGPLWDDLSTVTVGRNSDPLVRIRLPQTRQQRNGGDNAHCIPLTTGELHKLMRRVLDAARACGASTLIRSTAPGTGWDATVPRPPHRPAELLLIWQD